MSEIKLRTYENVILRDKTQTELDWDEQKPNRGDYKSDKQYWAALDAWQTRANTIRSEANKSVDMEHEREKARRRVNRDDWESIQCALCGVMVDVDQMKRKNQEYCSPVCRKSANSAAQWEKTKESKQAACKT